MSKCAVVGCENIEYIPFNNGLTFHRITWNKKYIPLWDRVVQIERVSGHDKICSIHFTEKDFVENKGKRRLKVHAVPSINILKPEDSTDEDDENTSLLTLKKSLTTSNEVPSKEETKGTENTSHSDSDDNLSHSRAAQNFQMVTYCDASQPVRQIHWKLTNSIGTQTKIKTDREISLQAKVKVLELRLKRRDAKISYMKTVLNMVKKYTKGTEMELKLCCELQNISQLNDSNLEDEGDSNSSNLNKTSQKEDVQLSEEEDSPPFVEVVYSPNLKTANGFLRKNR